MSGGLTPCRQLRPSSQRNGGGYGAHMEGGTVSNEGDTYPMKEYSRG